MMQKLGPKGDPPSQEDLATVGIQLGRPTRGEVGIVARCQYGLPVAVRTSPVLEDGTPFPTLFYLTCPIAVRDIGRLEATGMMDEMREKLANDQSFAEDYRQAHERYIRMRDEIAHLDEPMSAGGMPERVKCLHALYAHELGDSNPIGAEVASRIEPLDCPGPCTADLGSGELEAVPGHPGMRKRKGRR